MRVPNSPLLETEMRRNCYKCIVSRPGYWPEYFLSALLSFSFIANVEDFMFLLLNSVSGFSFFLIVISNPKAHCSTKRIEAWRQAHWALQTSSYSFYTIEFFTLAIISELLKDQNYGWYLQKNTKETKLMGLILEVRSWWARCLEIRLANLFRAIRKSEFSPIFFFLFFTNMRCG